jgi:hypothetical protein
VEDRVCPLQLVECEEGAAFRGDVHPGGPGWSHLLAFFLQEEAGTRGVVDEVLDLAEEVCL